MRLVLLALVIEATILGLNRIGLSLESRFYESHGGKKIVAARHPKVVFMGSSTILFGIDPNEVADRLGLARGEVINLAGAGFTPIHSLHAWNDHANILDSVRYVFYGLDSWLFSERKFQRDDYLTLGWSLGERLWIVSHPSSFHPYVRTYCLTGIPLIHVLSTSLSTTEQSSTPTPGDEGLTFGGERLFQRAWDPWTPPSKDLYPQWLFPVSDLCFDRLANLRDTIAHSGAELILVLPPKHTNWRNDYATNCRDFDANFIARFSRDIGSFPIVGSFRMFANSPDSSYLQDYVHLNRNGQLLFSRAMADTIRTMWGQPLLRASMKPLSSY